MKSDPAPTISRCIETLTRCCAHVENLRLEKALIAEDMTTHYRRMEVAMNDLRRAIDSDKPETLPPQIVEMHVHTHGLDEVTL